MKRKAIVGSFLMMLFLISVTPMNISSGVSDSRRSYGLSGLVTQSTVDWPMFSFNPAHTGTTPESVTPPLQLKWTYTTGQQTWFFPVVADGKVYVGSHMDLFALDSTTGPLIWNYTTPGYDEDVASSAVSSGVLYLSRQYGLDALNASTGAMIWTANVWYPGAYPFVGLCPLVVSNGLVYLSSSDDGLFGGNVWAFDAVTGALRWRYFGAGGILAFLAVSNGVVYVDSYFSGGRGVYALDAATGAWKWNYTTSLSSYGMAVSDGVVYLGSGQSVLALGAADGSLLWTSTIGGFFGSRSSPAVSGGLVYMGANDSKVYAFDAASGAVRWSFTAGGHVSSPAVSGGVVYVGAMDNKIYALNATTGAFIWSYTTGGPIGTSSPAVSGGSVYIVSGDGKVYAFFSGVFSVSTLWDPIRDSYSQTNYGSTWSAGGNCYGLSSTEILYFIHYILGDTAYPYFPGQNPSAPRTSDLILPKFNTWLNNASLAVMFHQVYDPNNRYIPPSSQNDEFYRLVAALESGTPALLVMAGVNSTGNAVYHAIVAYGATLHSDGTVSINVSDPNFPQTGGIATYDLNWQTFSYSAGGLVFFQFKVITPGMIQNSWVKPPWYYIGTYWWWHDWLRFSVPLYNIVITDKMVTVDSNGLLDYFTYAGNSQTFVKGIPGSSGIEEGNVQVYAIPMRIPFTVHDPGSNESIILITSVDNESGQVVGSGCFLNATTTQGFLNYTVTPSSAGLSLSTGDSALNASVTFFSATNQAYSVSQPLNVQVDAAQTVNFTALYVSDLVPSKTIVGQGYNVPVNMTVLNMAGSAENVNLTVFANTTAIDTEIISNLPNGTSTYSFGWNTSSLAYGNYTITAIVLTNDTAIAGGNCTFQTTVSISIAGDVNGDFTVDIYDAIILAGHYNSKPGDSNWKPNVDINGDNIVDIFDAILLANNFNKHVP